MSRWFKITLLLFFLALCGAAMLVTHRARQRIPEPSARDLYAIVTRQLSALRSADYHSAYQFAATDLQEQFSPGQFELMIRRDFASMTEAEHIEFGAVRTAAGAAMVQVFLTSPDGTMRGFLYSFTAEKSGWKINGVQPFGPRPFPRLPGLHI